MQCRYNLLKVPEPFCGLGAGGGVTGAGGGVDGLACWKKLNAGGAAFFFTSGFFSSTTGAGGGAGLALLVPKKSVRASVIAFDEAIGGTLGGGATAFGSGFLTTGFLTTGFDFGVLLAPKMFANGDEASFLGAGGFTTGVAAFLTTGAAFLAATGAAFLTTGGACLATGAVKQE